jgi:hypothetical protein
VGDRDLAFDASRWERGSPRWYRDRALNVVFGDRVGVALALAAIAFVGLYWRVDIFIVDSYSLGNAVASLSQGSLRIVTYPYEFSRAPGLYVVDGNAYARNYGHIVAATPLVWLLDLTSMVASVRLLLVAGWSLAVVGVAQQVAVVRGDDRVLYGGVAVATVAFLANAALATDLPAVAHPLIALQLVTIAATAALVVCFYRIFTTLYRRRVGVAAAATVLLVGPVGFWAAIPKRHLLIAAAVAGVVYALLRAHQSEHELRYRAGAYAIVGLAAWVSAPDALAMLAALGPVDLLTARRRDARGLGVLAGAFALALVPFLLTNAFISGNPFLPPRMLSNFGASHSVAEVVNATGAETVDPAGTETPTTEPTPTTETPGTTTPGTTPGTTPPTTAAGVETATPGTEPPGSTGGGDWLPDLVAISTILATITDVLGVFWGLLDRGLNSLAPQRVYHVLIRSGEIPGVDYSESAGEQVELTILETAPVLASLIAAPFAGRVDLDRLRSPTAPADGFAVLATVTFGLLYMTRLPVHSNITVRYLIPVTVLGVYGVFRLAPVREVLMEPRVLAASAGATVLGGGAFAVVVFAGTGDAIGGPMQAHAIANLLVAAVVAAWAVVAARFDVDDRLGAVVLGVAVGASALFVLLTGVEYFGDGRVFLLPLTDVLESLLPIR